MQILPAGSTLRDVLVFSRWMRLTYVIVFCLVIGFVTPLLLNKYLFNYAPPSNQVNGTCHIVAGVR